jgi:imidazole glycerol phosphate synthase subunit HisF
MSGARPRPVQVLDYGLPSGHCDFVALTPDNLDKVMAELVAVSRSAMSKREEAANLARIWGEDAVVASLRARATQEPGAEFRATMPAGRVRRRARWRRAA